MSCDFLDDEDNEKEKKVKKDNFFNNIWVNRFSLFFLITFFVLIFISFNSTFLINEVIRNVLFFFFLLCFANVGFNFKNFLKNKIFLTLFIIYIIGCSGFLIVVYGPFFGFRDWLITTAMNTTNHQYYCQWFYSDSQIDEVMSQHYMVEPDEDTDASLVVPNNNTSLEEVYANEYEEAVLSREEGTKFKLIEFDVNGQNAYLAVIYDPADVAVGVTQYLNIRGEYIYQMAERFESPIAINAGRFSDPNYSGAGGTPSGITYADYKLITGSGKTSKIIGFNSDNVLMLVDNCTVSKANELGIRDAVYSTPFLIVNGTPAFISGNGGWGLAARTAIGQRADGIVLFLVVDSNEFRIGGADMSDLTDIMMNYGAVNAANLDGGTSSAMTLNYEIINDPIDSALVHKTRPIATIFYLKP